MEEPNPQTMAVAERFGLSPTSALFLQAVTHPSFSHETPEAHHNQRLEFLGDAVLDFVVSEELFRLFPESDEGKLTRTRAQLVSTGALANYARHLDLGPVLRFGKGAASSNLRESANVLADAVEALLAAAYLEGGIDVARAACVRVLEFGLAALTDAGARDAKSELQETVQALGLRAPHYRVIATQGPAHEAVFEVEVSVEGVVLGSGNGRSKRRAERSAAKDALKKQVFVALGRVDVDAAEGEKEASPC